MSSKRAQNEKLIRDTLAFLETCKRAEEVHCKLNMGYDIYFGFFVERDVRILNDYIKAKEEHHPQSVYAQASLKDLKYFLNSN
jgi:hypothetical protein